MALALALAALSLASSLMGEADKNDALAQKATDFGIRKAGIDSAKRTRLDTLITQQAQIAESKQLANLAIDKSQAKAEADATVIAAAAGLEGDSVNQVINETAVNAVNAKYVVTEQTKNAKQQLKLSFVDTTLNADTQTGVLDTSTRNPALKHALAFATGFQSGFVSDAELEGTD